MIAKMLVNSGTSFLLKRSVSLLAEEAILNEEKTTMEEKMRILEGLPQITSVINYFVDAAN